MYVCALRHSGTVSSQQIVAFKRFPTADSGTLTAYNAFTSAANPSRREFAITFLPATRRVISSDAVADTRTDGHSYDYIIFSPL